MPISPARTIAFDVLLCVETEAAYASELLHARLNARVSARDAALAIEIVMGTLRWQRWLDFLAENYVGKKSTALDVEVLVALRIGIYQLRHLARIPASAAVDESVDLVKRARKQSAASLVNAVLRRAASESSKSPDEFLWPELKTEDALGLRYSHPTWLVEHWLARFGREQTVALLEANNEAPRRACALSAPESPEFRVEVMHSLTAAGVEFESGRLVRNAITIRGGDVTKTKAFQNGWISFQDEASQIIPLLMEVKVGQSVLDLCAAPGGKTMALARKAGSTALVVAADRREGRLRAMRERLGHAGVSNVRLVALDGTASLPFSAEFDWILVDAPCSGTGTLSRNPEIRWKLKQSDLAELHSRQVMLFNSALECLAPEGRLVYSTCSLEHEENEDVVSEVLGAHPEFRAIAAEFPPDALAKGVRAETLFDNSSTFFRTFPPLQHADGFFATVLARR